MILFIFFLPYWMVKVWLIDEEEKMKLEDVQDICIYMWLNIFLVVCISENYYQRFLYSTLTKIVGISVLRRLDHFIQTLILGSAEDF